MVDKLSQEVSIESTVNSKPEMYLRKYVSGVKRRLMTRVPTCEFCKMGVEIRFESPAHLPNDT
jgi:hypothetical protein